MTWQAFATDFDGTIATDGTVDETTMAALQRIRAAGTKTILVTGRVLDDFAKAPEMLGLFDRVIGENGAVLYTPATGETRLLAAAPPPEFAAELVRRGLPVGCGHVIVATVEPHEAEVLETIKNLALELQVIFNKGAVMVLPSGVNKASGLRAALVELRLAPENTVAVGDAENDHDFLTSCGLPVAVANALPALKKHAQLVTRSNAGAGVVELIDALISGQLEPLRSPETR